MLQRDLACRPAVQRVVGDDLADRLRGTGRIVDEIPGGYPALNGGKPCADGDNDGIPDAWESKRGLDPRDRSDAQRVNARGYTHLEAYLNGQ